MLFRSGGKRQHGAASLGQRTGHGSAAVGCVLALGGKGDLTVRGAFQFYPADARHIAHSGQHGVSLALRGSAQTAAGIQSLAQLLRAANSHQMPLGEDEHLLAYRLHLAEDVAGQNDRVRLAQLPDEVANLFT